MNVMSKKVLSEREAIEAIRSLDLLDIIIFAYENKGYLWFNLSTGTISTKKMIPQ